MPQPDQPHDLAAFSEALKRIYRQLTPEEYMDRLPFCRWYWRRIAETEREAQVVTRG